MSRYHENTTAQSRAKYEKRYGAEKADQEEKESTDKKTAVGESKEDKKKSPAPKKEV